MLTVLFGLASLSACGGGGPATETTQQLAPVASAPAPAPAPSPTEVNPTTPAQVAATVTGSESATRGSFLLSPSGLAPSVGPFITDVKFESTDSAAQTGAPVTFGHVFAPGHLLTAQGVVGKLADGTTVPLQLDVKARHADGSVRHAVISAILPSLAIGQTQSMGLHKTSSYAANVSATPSAVLSAGFAAAANLTVAGQQYTASADALLKTGQYTSWLAGPIVNEWHVSAPLTTEAGVQHPHLTARFAIRTYTGSKKTRVDVTIENNWAYEAAPQNFTYDAEITVGGTPVYAKAGMTHYHHARWRKMFWWGGEPQVHVKHNIAYLIDSKGVPNYDRSLVIGNGPLDALKASWTGTKIEPMGVGVAEKYMPSTGGRVDIGLLPGWAATYLLSMDKRAKDVTLGTADLAGSWSSHYRNKTTDRPVSLIDFPYMTLQGTRGDTKNPATKLYEAFPACATTTACASPYKHDASHQPSLAYLPYLVTGDYYYLEELQFWAMWNTFMSNPHYREFGKGLFKSDQVRGQAWSLRSLGEAAYITPDSDPLKAQFNYFLTSNINWYTAQYVTNPDANRLGALVNGYAVVYDDKTGIAPWQDDFFTAAVGRTVEMGFDAAKPLALWKAKFPIGRMTADGYCWILGAKYNLKLRDSETAPFYDTFAKAYASSLDATAGALECASPAMASHYNLKINEMSGYSDTYKGYPSNMQPALAYSADLGGASGAAAWAQFMSRSVKPDYSLAPQFAIVPR